MESKTIQSLTGRKLKITDPGHTYIHLDFTENGPGRAYGNFNRKELIAALAALGVRGDEFPKEPTPQELHQERIRALGEAASDGMVITVHEYDRDPGTVYHRIGGTWIRPTDPDRKHYTSAEVLGWDVRSTYKIKYPKED